jgi:hypothetical protein
MDWPVRELVKNILLSADDRQWTLQGFGMLRAYISEEVRLHVWDNRFANPGVSTIHDHPWAFESFVVVGQITNRIYCLTTNEWRAESNRNVVRYQHAKIKCGEGGGLIGKTDEVLLRTMPEYIYHTGGYYTQLAEDLHESIPLNGTVTLVKRIFVKKDRDHANVYWKSGDWGTAEPRPATAEEVKAICNYSLEKWFK